MASFDQFLTNDKECPQDADQRARSSVDWNPELEKENMRYLDELDLGVRPMEEHGEEDVNSAEAMQSKYLELWKLFVEQPHNPKESSSDASPQISHCDAKDAATRAISAWRELYEREHAALVQAKSEVQMLRDKREESKEEKSFAQQGIEAGEKSWVPMGRVVGGVIGVTLDAVAFFSGAK